MDLLTKINENIYRFKTPYKDIFTTVCVIKTEKGVMLFDAASYDTDTDEYILPALRELGIGADEINYIFISHDHNDHAGGLLTLLKHCTKAAVIGYGERLEGICEGRELIKPGEDDVFLDVLRVVFIPGHTKHSIAILDTRTGTLISGDGLQLYGIFGSGKWGANIGFPSEHIDAVEKLYKMDINEILPAHDYHPFGYRYVGREAVRKALDACIAPLAEIKWLIEENPELDDEGICKLYNADCLPTVGERVVSAIRKELEE